MVVKYLNRVVPALLPHASLVKTSDVDKAEWNYRPVLGLVQRLRFRMVVSLLPSGRVGRLLEVGYGSGVFLPELARHCDQLYAIDTHRRHAEVSKNLRSHGVHAHLSSGSALDLPFPDHVFDCIVAVSCLEYMEPVGRAARELKRVLRAGGSLVFVTPGQSPLVDFGHYLWTGCRAGEHYGSRRTDLVPRLLEHFAVERDLRVPRLAGRLLTCYRAMRLVAPAT